MNRYAKGAIAAGAATVLLLGGLGTFALWSDSRTIGAGTVTSGSLELDAGDMVGTWYHYDDDLAWNEYAAEGDAVTASSYKVVPGDELIFIAEGIDLIAEGGELYFTVGASVGSAAQSGFTVGTPQVHDGGALTEVTDTTGFSTIPSGRTLYSVVATDGVKTETFAATVKVSFAAEDTQFQDLTLNLTEAAILVDQVVKTS